MRFLRLYVGHARFIPCLGGYRGSDCQDGISIPARTLSANHPDTACTIGATDAGYLYQDGINAVRLIFTISPFPSSCNVGGIAVRLTPNDRLWWLQNVSYSRDFAFSCLSGNRDPTLATWWPRCRTAPQCEVRDYR
jgi:hypothetical protein